MNAQHLISTAASISAILGFVALVTRWLHHWFARLEHAVALVEQRSQQLETNGGSSLRDDVTAIRSTLALHGDDLLALHGRVDTLSRRNVGTGG